MNFCIAYTYDPAQLEKAAAYDYVICNQNAPLIDTQQLAYFQVAHEVKRAVWEADELMHEYARGGGDQYILSDTGDHVAQKWGTSHVRLWDYRKPEFADAFLAATQLILDKYGGIFLDNCSGTWAKHPKGEMQAPLQELLLDMRRANPDAPIVGNSSQNWEGLNGELLEVRPNYKELTPMDGQVQPNLNMMVYRTPTKDDPQIEIHRQAAESKGAMFYACPNYQEVW